MNDASILALYFQRDERAIGETEQAYGGKLYGIAQRILMCHEDSQECVNDTYFKAWDSIPPQRPNYFLAYLAKICRHLAFGRLDWNQAAKRNGEMVALTEELEACIPDKSREGQQEQREIIGALNAFLKDLPQESRLLFLRRYWYGDSIREIAARYGYSESKVKTRLFRTREKLRDYLQKEGFGV